MSVPPPGVLADLSSRHSWPPGDVELVADQGAANHTYALGRQLVLRVARPGHDGDLAVEAVVLPLVHAAGLPVPDLLEHHPGGVGSPAWMLQRRCPGVRLDSPHLNQGVRSAGHRDLGRVLRVLHQADLAPPAHLVGALSDHPPSDVHQTVHDAAAVGTIGAQDAAWLHELFDHLVTTAGPRAPGRSAPVLIHGDAAASNVLVDPDTGGVLGLLDWGDAARAEAVVDLAKVEPRDLPATVAGYTQTDRHPHDAQDELQVAAGALVHHLTWALRRLGTPPRAGDLAWSATPGARLLGLLRLAGDSARHPHSPWAHLLTPPA